MNKSQRKEVSQLIEELIHIQERIECLKDEEQEKQDNTPDNLQFSERYERREEDISNLEDAEQYCRDAAENLQTTID